MEIWLPLRYTGYEISTLGRVRSVERIVPRRNRWGTINPHRVRARILRLGSRSGYLFASLHVVDKQVSIFIHREMMFIFGGPPPFPGAFVRHLNDKRDDNRLCNLAWGSQTDNMRDAIRNGRSLGGYRPKGSRIVNGYITT